MKYDFLAGEVLLIDKPVDWTSFDVVNKIRYLIKRHLGIKKIKVGHAGTLDPLATGLVIVCTGKFTKKIDEYQGMTKEYIADVRFGATTPTYDMESEPDATFPYDHITEEALKKVIQDSFSGEIEQIPPVYSAIKIKGQKAYDLARRGEKVTMKPRQVTIHKIDITRFDLPDVTLDVTCSKGTYIRSLAHDIGKALGSGAHLSGLRRTRIGDFSAGDAISMRDIEKVLFEG
jgi:tRNA pseudouridine55 synthase